MAHGLRAKREICSIVVVGRPSPSCSGWRSRSARLAGEFAVTANLDDHTLSVVAIDIGSQPANVAGPPPTDPSGPVLTGVQSTITVGGRPIGVARTVDGRLWVADGNAGVVNVYDSSSGDRMDTLQIGADQSVGRLAVPSGGLALATGAEITRAYATTGDGNLIYWDLSSNRISQTIPVGHNPVALILSKVEPTTGATTSNASTGIAPSSSTTTTSVSGTVSTTSPTNVTIPSTTSPAATAGTGTTNGAGG